MDRIEKDIAYLEEIKNLVSEKYGLTGNEALILTLDHMTVAFYNGLDEIDALDYALAFALEGKVWHKEFTIKVAHDIYHCPYYQETAEAADLWLSDPELAANAPYSLVNRLFDLYYKNWGEDTETFLWRCLCLGCLPSREWLEKSEEEKRTTFTSEMGWCVFKPLFQLSDQEIEDAFGEMSFHIDLGEEEEAEEETRNG